VNITQLRKECKLWQGRLGLQQWKISVVWSKPTDHPDAYGANDFDPNHMVSRIRLLHPKYHVNLAIDNTDLPIQTLVHELLHLSLFPLEAAAGFATKTPDEHWDLAAEQFINILSSALLKENP
jgi:hypothetical protein